jgi:hypothetical protein
MESLVKNTNSQLLEAIPALKEGKIVFLGSTETKNPEVRQGFFAQLRNDVNTAEQTASNEVLSMFMGFSNNQARVIRVVQAYKPALLKLEVGQVLPANMNIEVIDALQPFYEGQKGRKRPDGSAILKEGQPVYRKETIVAGEPNHNLIKDYDHIKLVTNNEVGAEINITDTKEVI